MIMPFMTKDKALQILKDTCYETKTHPKEDLSNALKLAIQCMVRERERLSKGPDPRD